MNIEDMGELKSFEPMPAETTLYLTAIRYESNEVWMAGPGGTDKAYVITTLQHWAGIDAARIYAVKLPAKRLGAA
jgi:hypothetical protein